MALRYSSSHVVSMEEVDEAGEMSLSALIRGAIVASEAQCQKLGRGENYVRALGVMWVIAQHEIEFTRVPRLNERVTIETEASSYNHYFCYRNFWYVDSEGNPLVHIHTTFALMNQETRKIHPVLEEIIEPFGSKKEKKIYRAPVIGKVISEVSVQKEVRVLSSDIDGNGHVNNSVYLKWLFAPLTSTFLATYFLRSVNVRYIKEVAENSLVKSTCSLSENQMKSTHAIKVGEILHAEAELCWEEKK